MKDESLLELKKLELEEAELEDGHLSGWGRERLGEVKTEIDDLRKKLNQTREEK